jgi:hypothetical protein
MYTLIQNQEGEIFAVSTERIERFPMADSYGDHGQICGHSDAGDWLEITTQDAADKATESKSKTYKVGDYIQSFEDIQLFDEFNGEEGFELNQIMCTGFNYHDGHNWATIAVDWENGWDAPYSYCDDELIAKFNIEVEDKEEIKKTSFGTNYQTESFELFDGNSASDWAAYQVLVLAQI